VIRERKAARQRPEGTGHQNSRSSPSVTPHRIGVGVGVGVGVNRQGGGVVSS
jgi:hypothetical protein